MKISENKKLIGVIKTITISFICLIFVGIIGLWVFKQELFTKENILELIPNNKILAMLIFVIMYVIKGISLFLPSAAINIASGVVFGIPMSFFVSAFGIYIEFTVMYLVGKYIGKDAISSFEERFPKIKYITEINTKNGVFVSFIIRILGVISYDVGSIYLGAFNVSYRKFVLGSMIGASINIGLTTLLGRYVLNPFCWQFFLIELIRVLVIFCAFLIRKYVLFRSFDDQ